ncbi:MAG: dihydroorotase [Ferruginibacter sp.]
MKVLIRQTRIIAPSYPLHGQILDILVTDGIISRMAAGINEPADQVIEQPGLCVSAGWVDIFADFADPGFEYRETLQSGAAAAAAGGFTEVFVIPNTQPTLHSKSQIEYITSKSIDTPVHIHPLGAITKNTEGKTLAEMYDMRQAGAVAFTDGINSLQSPGILLKALQYVKAFNGTIIQVPDDHSISANGLINEGITSTRLGLPGQPAIAEELMLARDIELLKYTGSRIHFTGISTKKSLDMVNAAKAGGLDVSCSVTPYHCWFCDEDLVSYDTYLKVNPPLRSRSDMLALREAVANGQVDCIASHHIPQNHDHKICEFEHAHTGMSGLETLFAVMNTLGCPSGRFVEMQAYRTRELYDLPVPAIAEGAPASLTLFNPEADFRYNEQQRRSQSANSAFTGIALKGKVIGILNKNKIYLNP